MPETYTSPSEFIKSIDIEKIDDAGSAYAVLAFLDSPDFANLDKLGVDIEPEFIQLKEFIETEFPQVLKGYKEEDYVQPEIEEEVKVLNTIEQVEVPAIEEIKPVEVDTVGLLKGRLLLVQKMIDKGKIDKEIGEARLKLIGKMLLKAAKSAPAKSPSEIGLEDADGKYKEGGEVLLCKKYSKKDADEFAQEMKDLNLDGHGEYSVSTKDNQQWLIKETFAKGGAVSKSNYYCAIKQKGEDWNKCPQTIIENKTWNQAVAAAKEMAAENNAEVRMSKSEGYVNQGHFFHPDTMQDGGKIDNDDMQAEKAVAIVLSSSNPLSVQVARIFGDMPSNLVSVKGHDGKPIDFFLKDTISGLGVIAYTQRYLDNLNKPYLLDELEYYRQRYGIKELDATKLFRTPNKKPKK
jgi:hypothetical protein